MRTRSGVQYSLGPSLSPVVKVLIWVNVLLYLSMNILGASSLPGMDVSYQALFLSLLGLHPEAVLNHKALWQLVTFLFLHGSFLHVLFNMLGLWWFGADLERVWGSKRFFQYYLFTGVGSGLVSLLMSQPTIGASGAIYGLLFAFGMLYPNRVIYLYFVIPIRAKYFVLLFGLVELAALTFSTSSGINHWAHLAGLFFGFVWFFFSHNRFDPRSIYKKIRYHRQRKKFTLIVNEEENEKDKENQRGPFADDNNPTIH